jgi:hypothetical protein
VFENSEPKKNHWCIVALNYTTDSAWVLHESQDCTDDMVFDEYDVMEYDRTWASGLAPGLYRLSLTVDADFNHVFVTNSELMSSFPPISDDGPNYLNITKQTVLGTEATETTV